MPAFFTELKKMTLNFKRKNKETRTVKKLLMKMRFKLILPDIQTYKTIVETV